MKLSEGTRAKLVSHLGSAGVELASVLDGLADSVVDLLYPQEPGVFAVPSEDPMGPAPDPPGFVDNMPKVIPSKKRKNKHPE